jgi:hypothetical protein
MYPTNLKNSENDSVLLQFVFFYIIIYVFVLKGLNFHLMLGIVESEKSIQEKNFTGIKSVDIKQYLKSLYYISVQGKILSRKPSTLFFYKLHV